MSAGERYEKAQIFFLISREEFTILSARMMSSCPAAVGPSGMLGAWVSAILNALRAPEIKRGKAQLNAFTSYVQKSCIGAGVSVKTQKRLHQYM